MEELRKQTAELFRKYLSVIDNDETLLPETKIKKTQALMKSIQIINIAIDITEEIKTNPQQAMINGLAKMFHWTPYVPKKNWEDLFLR